VPCAARGPAALRRTPPRARERGLDPAGSDCANGSKHQRIDGSKGVRPRRAPPATSARGAGRARLASRAEAPRALPPAPARRSTRPTPGRAAPAALSFMTSLSLSAPAPASVRTRLRAGRLRAGRWRGRAGDRADTHKEAHERLLHRSPWSHSHGRLLHRPRATLGAIHHPRAPSPSALRRADQPAPARAVWRARLETSARARPPA
jgi:hypothetical protein